MNGELKKLLEYFGDPEGCGLTDCESCASLQRIRDLFAQTVPREKVREILIEQHCRGQRFQDCLADLSELQATADADQLLAELDK